MSRVTISLAVSPLVDSGHPYRLLATRNHYPLTLTRLYIMPAPKAGSTVDEIASTSGMGSLWIIPHIIRELT